jgi:hypothetical protein
MGSVGRWGVEIEGWGSETRVAKDRPTPSVPLNHNCLTCQKVVIKCSEHG